MKVIDYNIDIPKSGNFLSLFGIADTHFLCDSEDEDAYQPVNSDYWTYLKYCAREVKANPKFFGKVLTFTGGDLTELERSSTRKVLRQIKKNDTRAQDTIHKYTLRKAIIPKLKLLTENTTFIGGVAGNHLIEFSQESDGTGYINSEDYIIKSLGGEYCGEGKLLLNIHMNSMGQRRKRSVLITHGSKGGSKNAVIRELQQIYYQYGTRIDVIVKAHAHEPMAGFHAAYQLPDTAEGKIKTHETLVVCLGSTRGGEIVGYDDYTERCNYPATAGRYPVIIFRSLSPCSNSCAVDIKIRPYIM